ncbi:hypothetical protein ACQ4PT_001873 [Festuca glaucescens]
MYLFGSWFAVVVDMDVSDLSSSSIEYDSGNTDEEELDFTSANENAPPEDEHTSGDDDVDESMDADGIDLEDDNVEQEEDVDTDNIQSDVVDEPNDDEKLDSSFVDEMEYDNVPDRRTNSLNTDGNKVGDPAKVAARGAPKKRKRRDDGEGPVTKNGRPLSYDERGKGIRCSRCKKPEHTKRSLKCELHPRHVAHVFVGQEDQ